jgi:hypothetical protein
MRLRSWMLGLCVGATPPLSADISGTVMDPTGAAVAGVVISLECPSAALREAATDESGHFQFETAGRARCTVRVNVPGFRAVRTAAVAGKPIRVELTLEAQRTELAVSETVSANTDTVAAERSMIENLPVLGNDVVAALSEFLDSPAMGAGGASVVVDGLEGPMRRLSAALIQEVRINQNPYAAEYSRPGRGRIDIVTRKGAGTTSRR